MHCFVQVQATHQQLQNMELAIDANESRARKLEFDLKVMSNMLWQVFPQSQVSIDFSYIPKSFSFHLQSCCPYHLSSSCEADQRVFTATSFVSGLSSCFTTNPGVSTQKQLTRPTNARPFEYEKGTGGITSI